MLRFGGAGPLTRDKATRVCPPNWFASFKLFVVVRSCRFFFFFFSTANEPPSSCLLRCLVWQWNYNTRPAPPPGGLGLTEHLIRTDGQQRLDSVSRFFCRRSGCTLFVSRSLPCLRSSILNFLHQKTKKQTRKPRLRCCSIILYHTLSFSFPFFFTTGFDSLARAILSASWTKNLWGVRFCFVTRVSYLPVVPPRNFMFPNWTP